MVLRTPSGGAQTVPASDRLPRHVIRFLEKCLKRIRRHGAAGPGNRPSIEASTWLPWGEMSRSFAEHACREAAPGYCRSAAMRIFSARRLAHDVRRIDR